MSQYDCVIVGAGFAGAVLAERLAVHAGQRILVLEKRDHIGGNAYDCRDEAGIHIHRYGPHIFHTNAQHVWEYLSQFTKWHPYEHKVLGQIDGKLVPIPFNLNSLDALFPEHKAKALGLKLIQNFGQEVKVPILKLRQSGDPDLGELAEYVYQKVFLNYTQKQWGMTPEALDPGVTGRVPIRISRDNRYFQDTYQGIPDPGYTQIFQKLLNHPKIEVRLNTNAWEHLKIDRQNGKTTLLGAPFSGKVVYTGKIDAFFDYCLGELPYRTLVFEAQTLQQEHYQPTAVVNYPNAPDFTRITEFKHFTRQNHPSTTLFKEYPHAYSKDTPGLDTPYYPVPQETNRQRYQRYRQLAKPLKNLIFIGRLAEYRYYDMDAIVARALKTYREWPA